MYQSPVARNLLQQSISNQTRESQSPVDEQHNISYGVISAVDSKTSQVRVRLLKEDGKVEETDILNGTFLPLLNPLEQIHHLWGALRPGLIVRIHWRGKLAPKWCVVEVVANEDSSFLTKDPRENELPIGPYRLFSGGIF